MRYYYTPFSGLFAWAQRLTQSGCAAVRRAAIALSAQIAMFRINMGAAEEVRQFATDLQRACAPGAKRLLTSRR